MVLTLCLLHNSEAFFLVITTFSLSIMMRNAKSTGYRDLLALVVLKSPKIAVDESGGKG